MGVTLLKVTNIGLKITDALTVPIIKCVISTDSDSENLTVAEFNSLKDEIYSRAGGMVSVSGFWTSSVVPPFSENTGVYNYGVNSSDGGYYLAGNNIIFNGRATSAQVTTINFNGAQISYPRTYTGYSAWETAHGFILVDENNQLYSCGACCLYVLYDVNPGITSIDNKIPAAVVTGGYSLFYDTEGARIRATGHDITDDITQEIDPENTDPYNPGGDSETGGGTGDFDGTGDDIDIPGLPTLSAVDTGFITLFNPSAGELRSLANYMWSNPLFDLDAWKKIFADPMDAILGLSIVPVAVPNGGQSAVTVGNISTGVSMNKAAAQYVSVDCGTLNINEYWGAYLDYDPYTKAEIYLPYIGTHALAVDDIMGKAVHVVYHVDILSGACCAFVKCGGSVLYSFVGQCAASIPITGNDWTNVINGALSIAASIGTMIATGGASAPLAASAIASTAVNSMKPNVEKSGSMGGMGGMLGVQTPYIILTRPRQALPNSQNKFMGYPSFITRKLSAVSGYTEIESIHLDGIPATEQELSEIENLLKGGVIL